MRAVLAIVIALVAMASSVYAIDVSTSWDPTIVHPSIIAGDDGPISLSILPGGCVDPGPTIIIVGDDGLIQIYNSPNESLNSDPAPIGIC